jgi:hypothetical protein
MMGLMISKDVGIIAQLCEMATIAQVEAKAQ